MENSTALNYIVSFYEICGQASSMMYAYCNIYVPVNMNEQYFPHGNTNLACHACFVFLGSVVAFKYRVYVEFGSGTCNRSELTVIFCQLKSALLLHIDGSTAVAENNGRQVFILCIHHCSCFSLLD
jgi:hypothetical protein